jgi:hypothetical protein
VTTRSPEAKANVQPIPKPEPQPKGRRERERPTLYTYGFLPGETPTCFLAQFTDTPCAGRLELAHLIRAQKIRQHVSNKHAVVWSEQVLRWACHSHHGMLDQAKTLRIPREAIPAETEQWASEHGLSWWLDETYGDRASA